MVKCSVYWISLFRVSKEEIQLDLLNAIYLILSLVYYYKSVTTVVYVCP
jgi:hypothetical protein